MRSASFNEGSLRGAWLNEAHLERASRGKARLDEALVDRAHLEGAWLSGASFYGASLSDTQLVDALLDMAFLGKAESLAQTQLEAAWGKTRPFRTATPGLAANSGSLKYLIWIIWMIAGGMEGSPRILEG